MDAENIKKLTAEVIKITVIASETKHKIVRNDFEQALLGPKGEGQEARSNLQKSAIHHEIATVILFPRNDKDFISFTSVYSVSSVVKHF